MTRKLIFQPQANYRFITDRPKPPNMRFRAHFKEEHPEQAKGKKWISTVCNDAYKALHPSKKVEYELPYWQELINGHLSETIVAHNAQKDNEALTEKERKAHEEKFLAACKEMQEAEDQLSVWQHVKEHGDMPKKPAASDSDSKAHAKRKRSAAAAAEAPNVDGWSFNVDHQCFVNDKGHATFAVFESLDKLKEHKEAELTRRKDAAKAREAKKAKKETTSAGAAGSGEAAPLSPEANDNNDKGAVIADQITPQ